MSLTTDDEAKLNKLSNVSNKDVKIFINEMIKYFKDNWRDEYQKDLDNFCEDSTLQDFNNLFNNSRTTRKEVIDDSFTGPVNIDNISSVSKTILYSLTGIMLK